MPVVNLCVKFDSEKKIQDALFDTARNAYALHYKSQDSGIDPDQAQSFASSSKSLETYLSSSGGCVVPPWGPW